jgi:hypothetical protein
MCPPSVKDGLRAAGTCLHQCDSSQCLLVRLLATVHPPGALNLGGGPALGMEPLLLNARLIGSGKV